MKKLCRKIIIVQILLSVIIVLSIGKIYASDASNLSLYHENCNNSVQIFNNAIEPFKASSITRTANVAYSNNYAGSFIDGNGILNIGYLQNDNIPSSGKQVQYIQMKFPYNYLLEIKNIISEKMIEYNVNTVSIDEESNKVDVQVPNQNVANGIISYLNGLNLYNNDALNITIDNDNYPILKSKTIYGGDKINDSVLGFLNSYGTICMNVYDNETGKYGVLTNAHVAEANTTMYHNGSILQGTKIGVATKRQHSGTIDAAFVPFDKQDKWDVTTHARSGNTTYNNIRLGSENLIIQGAPVRKLGQTSGNTTGTIQRTNYDCRLEYNSVPTVISNTIMYSNQSLGGDSGGPVYYDGGGQNLFLIAMNFAGPAYENLFTFGIGCNIFDVIETFNVTPILDGTIFDTTNIGNDEIRIDKLVPIIPSNPKFDSVEFEIPSYINDRKVTEISNSAFANQRNITSFVLPDKLIKIGSSAFKDCVSLTSITIPNSVTNIDSSAFENCHSLTNVTLSNDLTNIGSSAFKGCASLFSITIPSSVSNIGSSAFENCRGLNSVTILKETDITDIGSNVFNGCTSLNKIIVPSSKFFKYRTANNWSLYENLIEYSGLINEYDFHCRTAKTESSISVSSGKTIVYILNIDCPIQYKIDASASYALEMNLYDANMNLVTTALTTNCNDKYSAFFYPLLQIGKYYVEISFVSNTISGEIKYEISPYTNTNLDISLHNQVNVLNHLHDGKNIFKICSSRSGLFLLEIEGKIHNDYENPQGTIIIKDYNGNIVEKCNISDYVHSAESVGNANNIMFYAEKWGSYDVYVEVNELIYDELNLYITNVEDFNIVEMNENDEYIDLISMPRGDFAYIYNLDRAGTYDISFNYLGNQTSNMLFVLWETNINGEYVYKDSYEINNTSLPISFIEQITTSKNIMLCVFDSEGNGSLDIDISKRINSNSFTILTDPTINTSGSEVKLNNGSLQGTTITEGFTRICYLGTDAPNTLSRYTYYNWYSTNSNVAIVSAYGTITAVGVGTTIIQAVYKADPSIIATLQITVVSDTNITTTYLNYGMDVRESGTTSGTEVTSGLGSIVSVSNSPYVSIHKGYTRLICLGNESPNSSIQSFNWTVCHETGDTGMVTVSSFGTIKGVTSGWVTVKGIYKYNPRFIVEIRIYVEA